jgi:hypothetical protein
MPRIRSIKPEFWQDTRMARLPALDRMVFICLWSMADDEGRLEGDAETVRRFGSFREDSREVASALATLAKLSRIVIYEVEGNPYIAIRHFNRHQKIDKPSQSKLPDPSKGCEPFGESSRLFDESSRSVSVGSGIRDQGSGIKDQLPAVPAEQRPAPSSPKRGTRLPADWQLPKTWGEWAQTERPDWTDDDIRRVALAFRNHWVAKAGRDATKLDWLATWQNWVLKEPGPRGPAGQRRGRQVELEARNRAAVEEFVQGAGHA